MTTCEQFENAIARRRRGVIDADEMRALAAHLLTCAACRDYESIVERTSTGLHEAAKRAAANVDWSDLDIRINQGLSARRRRIVFGSVLATGLVPLIAWGTSSPEDQLRSLVVSFASVAVVMLIFVARIVVDTRRLTRLAEPMDLLAFHKESLHRQLSSFRFARWFALAALVRIGFKILWPEKVVPHGYYLVYAVAAIILACALSYGQFVRSPRLSRELASMEPGK